MNCGDGLLEGQSGINKQAVWLGYGDGDRLTGHTLLAGYLGLDRVLKVEGTHHNPTFSTIWNELLKRKPF